MFKFSSKYPTIYENNFILLLKLHWFLPCTDKEILS